MNSLDTNKKEVIDMYYDHRILQNLFNFDVVTEKTNQHVKTLDSLKEFIHYLIQIIMMRKKMFLNIHNLFLQKMMKIPKLMI